jgi:hypothetical protein
MALPADTLDDVKTLLKDGWRIRWDGETGREYPTESRIVQFEKNFKDESHPRVRQLYVSDEDFRRLEQWREEREQ